MRKETAECDYSDPPEGANKTCRIDPTRRGSVFKCPISDIEECKILFVNGEINNVPDGIKPLYQPEKDEPARKVKKFGR